MKVATYSKTGSKASSDVSLDKAVFEVMPETTTLLAQVYEANRHGQRTINSLAKTRSMVRGGGRKPWRQKGTGRARAGTIRSPLWRGGGVTFGPTGQMSDKKVSKQSRKVALKQALSLSAKNGSISIIESFDVSTGKTKDAAKLIDKLSLSGKTTFVLDDVSDSVKLATRNIQNLNVISFNSLNVNDVLDADNLVITKKALGLISDRLGARK